MTTYKAGKASGARSSSLVAVFGAGGLGHLAIQHARITGACVTAVDVNPARLDTAREIGAEHLVTPRGQDPIAAIQRLGTRHDLEEVFELHRRGLTRVEYAERHLDDVNSAIAEVLDGTAPAPRLVFRMQPAEAAGENGRAAIAHA